MQVINMSFRGLKSQLDKENKEHSSSNVINRNAIIDFLIEEVIQVVVLIPPCGA